MRTTSLILFNALAVIILALGITSETKWITYSGAGVCGLAQIINYVFLDTRE